MPLVSRGTLIKVEPDYPVLCSGCPAAGAPRSPHAVVSCVTDRNADPGCPQAWYGVTSDENMQ
jgi:TPP-dependent indolepyruvate ferredoxin oxidoreductase alpha subunit